MASGYNRTPAELPRILRQILERNAERGIADAQIQQAYDWSRNQHGARNREQPSSAPVWWPGTGLPAKANVPDLPGTLAAIQCGLRSRLTPQAISLPRATALQFISKYQREDGKIPHEIAQAATFVPWFKDFPYGYASADATPLYIIAMND